MKNVFCATALLLGLSVLFISCEKSGAENGTGKNEEYPIVGCWIFDSEENGSREYSDKNSIYEYFEFTNTGHLKEYYADKGNATYKDGVLSYSGKWKLEDVYDYWIEDGLLYLDDDGIDVYEFNMIGKDKFSISETTKNGKRITDYCVRIKKFSK